MKRFLLLISITLAAFLATVLYRGDHGADIATARHRADGDFIALRDGIVHYEMAGAATAPTVVLVHGFATPYYVWDPTFDALRWAGFRVIRYDLYGRGYSDRPQLDYDSSLFDRQLANLLASLEITGKIHLVGLSMGGLVVTTFADRHPELVRSLTLIDTAGFPIPLAGAAPLVRIPVLGELAMWLAGEQILLQTVPKNFVHPENFGEFARKYALQFQYEGFLRAILSTLRYMPLNDMGDTFRRVGKRAVPTLVFWGNQDQVTPVQNAALVHAAIPHAKVMIIQDAGHLCHLEKPEAVSPSLISFLRAAERY